MAFGPKSLFLERPISRKAHSAFDSAESSLNVFAEIFSQAALDKRAPPEAI